jgi:hypothetical protein
MSASTHHSMIYKVGNEYGRKQGRLISMKAYITHDEVSHLVIVNLKYCSSFLIVNVYISTAIT